MSPLGSTTATHPSAPSEDRIPFLSSSSANAAEAFVEEGVVSWCTPQLRQLNREAFASFNPSQVRIQAQQQAARIQNEKLDALRRQHACAAQQEQQHESLQVVQIGRYPGIGPQQELEAEWEVVVFALLLLVATYAFSAILFALAGFCGKELVLLSSTIGAPTLMLLAGGFVWCQSRQNSSPLTNASSLELLVRPETS